MSELQKRKNLRGYKFRTITGILVDEIVSDYKLIVCQNCGKKKKEEFIYLDFNIWLVVVKRTFFSTY